MEDGGAGCDRDGGGVQKAALEVAWRRGLETRLWGPTGWMAKTKRRQLPRSPGPFQATCVSLCEVTVCLESRRQRWEQGAPWVLLHYLGLHLPKASKPSGVPRASQPFFCSLSFSLRKTVSKEHSWVKFHQPCVGEDWPRQTCEDAALLRLLLWAVHGPAHACAHRSSPGAHPCTLCQLSDGCVISHTVECQAPHPQADTGRGTRQSWGVRQPVWIPALQLTRQVT